MGTRAVVLIHELGVDSDVLARVYFQYDGYLTGVGKKIFDAFNTFVVSNGIGYNDPNDCSNGMGCFGATFIAVMKEKPGGTYLSLSEYEEYTYHLYIEDDGKFYNYGSEKQYFPICMSVENSSGEIWSGELKDFNPQEIEDQEEW